MSYLTAPKFGCINVHASLLPELRGGAPIHYAIIQGKEKTGVTIMYMAEKLDAGDILTQVEVPILEDDNVGTMHEKLSEAGAKLLSETFRNLLEGRANTKSKMKKRRLLLLTLKENKKKSIGHNQEKTFITIFVALNPWPVAYTTFEMGLY